MEAEIEEKERDHEEEEGRTMRPYREREVGGERGQIICSRPMGNERRMADKKDG